MNIKIIAPVVAVCATLLPGYAFSQQLGGGFDNQFYIGIGGGLSALEPDTSAVPSISLIDDRDSAICLLYTSDAADE